MQVQKINIQDLRPNENNVRKHTKVQIDQFCRSINDFGVIRPIVIDEDNVILAGHGLYQALIELNKTEADVIILSGLSANQKKKLLLADNKIYSLGLDDYSAIDKILSELGAENDFSIPGYDADTLESLYGIKSIEDDVTENGTPVSTALSDMEQDVKKMPSNETETKSPAPSKHVQEARAEAENRHFIICPNCGERIEV